MAKKGSTPAPAPDPFATSQAQTSSNVATGIANSYMGNANESSPYGSVNYTQNGTHTVNDGQRNYDVPSFNRDVTLSPWQQTLLDQQQQLGFTENNIAGDQLFRINDLISQPVSTDGLPNRTDDISPGPNLDRIGGGPTLRNSTGYGQGLQFNVGQRYANTDFAPADAPMSSFSETGPIQSTFGDTGNITRTIGPDDFSADRQKVEDAINSRQNPELDRQKSALDTQLVNSGLQRGSPAYNEQMDSFNRQSNDAHMQAILAGGQEQSRMFGMALGKGQFENAAQQQDYGQQLGRGQFANAAQQQLFGQQLGRTGLYNQAQQQYYNQQMGRGQFANQAQQQNLNADLASGQFANQAQQQGYGQAMSDTDLYNQSAQQGYTNDIGATQYNNSMGQQDFANRQDMANFQNTARERALQEQLALRNQPLNEISTLMSGGQVSMPQFTPFRGGQVAPTDVSGNVYNSANINAANWRQQQQVAAQAAGGLYGLGGAAIGGLARYGLPQISDRSLKTDIVRIATNPLGLGIYSYRYKWGGPTQVGYMADEVERVLPHAVNDNGAFKSVLYHLVEAA